MRRNVMAGYPRGEETRARILNAAIHLFGLNGFDGVTTREIAAAAAVPAPSLRYYFVSKEGLYAACHIHIQASLMTALEPALLEAERLLADDNDDIHRLGDVYCAMQEALLDFMIAEADSPSRALFIVRHDLPNMSGKKHPVGAHTTTYRLVACFSQLLIRISNGAIDRGQALVVGGLLNGPLTNIYIRRARLAEIGLDLTGDRLRWLRQTIRQHTMAALLSYRSTL